MKYVPTSKGTVKVPRGSGSVFWRPPYVERQTGKKKRGHWVLSLTLDGRRRHFYFVKKQDAWEKLIELRGLAPAGEPTLTVGAYLQRWLDEVRPSLKPKTWRQYQELVKREVLPALENVPLKNLQAKHVQKLIDARSKALAPKTLYQVRAVLSSGLGHAVRRHLLGQNPIAGRAVTLPRMARTVPNLWSQTQMNAFLKSVGGDPYEAMWKVALGLGLRPSELLALRWDDVDFERETLLVRHDPKTPSGIRALPMPIFVVRALRARKKRRADDGLVFATAKGGPLGHRNVVRYFKRAVKHAGLPDLRLYDLRSMFITRLALRNVPVRVAMEMAGHASVVTTMDIYARVGAADTRDAIKTAWG